MNEKLTKNERRAQAREQARLAQETEKKREKRNRLMLQGGIVVGVLAVVAIVGLVLTQTMKPAGPGPLNMISGGVTFAEDLKVVPTAALQSGEERTARDVDWEEGPIDVMVFVDYLCPHCGEFEQTYGTMLEQYVGSGDITLTVYPLNLMDSQSLGTKYSTRAANLLACVVEEQPDYAFAVHNRLLSVEGLPTSGSSVWTDEQLVEQAEAVGASGTTELKQCVKDQRFASFISANYKQVSENGILGLAEGAQLFNSATGELVPADQPQRLMGTPTVIVNGQQWVSGRDSDLESYILKLKSEIEGDAPESTDDDSAS